MLFRWIKIRKAVEKQFSTIWMGEKENKKYKKNILYQLINMFIVIIILQKVFFIII